MSDSRIIVTGVYQHLDSLLGTVRGLQGRGHDDLTVYSPTPRHEIDEALGEPESKVGFFALGGGITGWIVGLALTVGTAIYLPLIVGGKPIVSFVPFYVIGFEMTILLGGLFTLLGFLRYARLSREARREPFDQRFAEDRFGVAVRCPEEARSEVENILRSNDAEEVNVEQI